jgi:hypothetical protein
MNRSRWLDWKPRAEISPDFASSEPSKPSRPSSVGFGGSTLAQFSKIEQQFPPPEFAFALRKLNRAGARLMDLDDGSRAVGVWSDLDSPEIRAALEAVGLEKLPVQYLDGTGVSIRYKVRRVEGEPVPLEVVAEMEERPQDACKLRDRLLKGMNWCPQGSSWEAWKSAKLSRLCKRTRVIRRAATKPT